MKFGLFSNSRRPGQALKDVWDQDIEEIIVADALGFQEAWISEHESPAELILCKAVALTKQIMLGSGVRPLPCYHPFQVAVEAMACDHLTDGRYMLGVGPGFTRAKTELRGGNFDERREVTDESLDVILRLLTTEEPFDLDSKYWTGKAMKLPQRPIQRPYPPIGVSVVTSRETSMKAGRLGLTVLMADFSASHEVKLIGDYIEEGQAEAGLPASRDLLRPCRVVFVGETDAEARDAMRESYNGVIKWEIKNAPHHQVNRIPPGGTMDDITFDYLVDTGNLFIGSAETVRQMIEQFHAEAGGFGGLLLHAGRNYATHEGVLHSMKLLAEGVIPKLHVREAAERQAA